MMDHALLTKADIDCEKGIERCMGNEELYTRLLRGFLTDTNMADAKRLLTLPDYEGAYPHLHEIKGVSGNLGIHRLYELSSTVLARVRSRQYDELPLYCERLFSAYDEAIGVIRIALD